jgi:UDP:flavonoid glycosyltransferase YjiC (YdhE family)
VVVLHAGHGTLVRALANGCSVVCVPAGGDMNENAARIDWAGLGIRIPPRWLGARTLQLAVRRALRPAVKARVHGVAAWAAANDGAVRAAEELERWAAERRAPGGPAAARRPAP